VFWGIGVVGFFGLALVVPVYTSCVPRGALRFFIKVLLTYQKKSLQDEEFINCLNTVETILTQGYY
jgi:hypothetical protein